MTPDDLILIERAALQISGMQGPISHLHAVLRGLGLSPARAAHLFFPTLDRAAELEAGVYTQRTVVALLACEMARDVETAPDADAAFAAEQRMVLRDRRHNALSEPEQRPDGTYGWGD